MSLVVSSSHHLLHFFVPMSLLLVVLISVVLVPSSASFPSHPRSAVATRRPSFPFEKTLWMNASSLAKCPRDMFSCSQDALSVSCLDIGKRCDGRVDCPNAEDEVNCVCAFRLPTSKFCDKYPDCFDESDESFCAYCPQGAFNCGDGKCVPRNKVCDTSTDCPNAMDENSCFSLSQDGVTPSPDLLTGFLMRQQQGTWLPVCAHPHDRMQRSLASFACSSITANSMEVGAHQPKKFPAKMASGASYIYHYMGRFVRWPGCATGNGLAVTCGSVHCGVDPRPKRRARIVGGERSRAGAWPWHAAIYKNGTYVCGATLVSDQWLISAAHCFLNHRFHYYEVQLGMLRRRSFSPHQKTFSLNLVVPHPKFNVVTLEYDLVLLRVSQRVPFDLWVRPICLPGPDAPQRPSGHVCTAVGWGDLGEMEDDSDDLQEVHVPVTRSCQRNLERWVCAGYLEGGRDACQGDSGGPLMCPGKDGTAWDIAGVISAGRGCARPKTPGMYTRVAYFREWIDQVMLSPVRPEVPPLASCPGMRCAALGGGNCLRMERVCDEHVDCYDARDEVDCKEKRLE